MPDTGLVRRPDGTVQEMIGMTVENQSFKTGRGRLFIFLFMFAAFLLYALIHRVDVYYYDASYYWNWASGMFADGRFSLYGFPETFRGYFYPMVCQIVRYAGRFILGSDVWGFRVISCLMYAAVFGIALPGVFGYRPDSVRKVVRLCLLVVPVLFFWGDLMQYPLSDMPAFCFACAGMFLLDRSFRTERRSISALCGFGAGLLLYAAYNTRVVFLYGIVCAILIYGFFYGVKRPEKRMFLLLALIAAFAGAALAAVPQMLINAHYTGSATPRVLTEQLSGYGQNLQMSQVYWGLTTTRYETYVGESYAFPFAGVLYNDPIGSSLIELEKLTDTTFSFSQWMGLFLRHPMDMIGIYAKHVVSMLTCVFPDVFVHELYASKALRICCCILLWLIGGLGVVFTAVCRKERSENSEEIGDNRDWPAAAALICLILPSGLQLFGAPEVRFALSAHVLLYFRIVCVTDHRLFWKYICKHLLPVAISCIIIAFAWVSIIGTVLSEATVRPQLIHDVPFGFVPSSSILKSASLEITDSQSEISVVDLGALLSDSPVKLENDTFYEISFDLDCGGTVPQLLYFDFYGTDYDSPQQDFSFEYTPGQQHYSKVCASGQVAADAMIRLIYITDQPYELENFNLSVVQAGR